jgi:spore maturation protein CgeB
MMRPAFALFYHSLVSDWNHGNAHFLRGYAGELRARGHEVRIFEPAEGWSRSMLKAEGGEPALRAYAEAYPGLESRLYDPAALDLDEALDGIDVVIAHEWNDPAFIARLGRHRRGKAYRLLFHDTHHRSATDPAAMAAYDLGAFDGVLAYGEVIRRLYLERGWARRAWTWHEAADVRVFRPRPGEAKEGDLIWIGNWGDGERSRELEEFLIRPAGALGLSARLFGVRYPPEALAALSAARLHYGGWLPNHAAPRAFSRFRVTVHVPRRPYVEALPGIPTIRPFEALACGIPLICAPWNDAEGLFRPGRDYLVAKDGAAMRAHLRAVLADPGLAASLAAHGLETIRARHTCAHRVGELLAILEEA